MPHPDTAVSRAASALSLARHDDADTVKRQQAQQALAILTQALAGAGRAA